jgi:cell division septal protein FtsQ
MNVATGFLVRERWRTVLNVSLLVLLATLMLELVFYLVVAPNLRVSRVEILGAKPVDDAALLKLLGLRDREYYFSFSEAELQDRLGRLPWVKSSHVDKVFPDGLQIHLTPRQALVLSLAGSAVMAVDEDGVVFDVRSNANGWDLPIVSGLTFASTEPGSRVPEVLVPLFARLAELRTQSPALFRLISELSVRKNDRGSYDVAVFPAQTPVRILLGDQWNAQVLQQMFVLLDLVKRQGWIAKTKEIDFRATPVVLRPRES